ncbi:MAG: methyltransferase domain-containing protein [Anaerolineales bacterium]
MNEFRNPRDLEKAALQGEPSYVWREGQQRRMQMILEASAELIKGCVLENGCGVGMYVEHLVPYAGMVVGLEYDLERAGQAHLRSQHVLGAKSEFLPFQDETFDIILSHEVLEHVHDDRIAIKEMVRVASRGGRIIIFVPNRGYPFETHGVYFRGRYHFGNIPLINYLPKSIRNRFAPHVRVYSQSDLEELFSGMPVTLIQQTVIFGGYDNIIARFPRFGKVLRKLLQWMEGTPLRRFGLSHFWVVEKRHELGQDNQKR